MATNAKLSALINDLMLVQTRMIRQSAKMYSRSKRATPPPTPSRASPLLPRPSG
jgi:hypothetical protein